MEKKYNIGLVGCGRISKNHFDAIYENREYLNLVAVCDNNPQQKENSPIEVDSYCAESE